MRIIIKPTTLLDEYLIGQYALVEEGIDKGITFKTKQEGTEFIKALPKYTQQDYKLVLIEREK